MDSKPFRKGTDIFRYHTYLVLQGARDGVQRRKRNMIIAIVLGAISGVLGFLPLYLGLRLARKATPTSNLGHAGALLLGVLLSFLILVAAFGTCALAARDLVLPFVLAEVAGLVVSAIAFGFGTLVRK